MYKETSGSVIAVKKQYWFKINTKPIRLHAWDGAVFPHIIKAEYKVNDQTYTCRKWLWPSVPLPRLGSEVTVQYLENKPSKGKII